MFSFAIEDKIKLDETQMTVPICSNFIQILSFAPHYTIPSTHLYSSCYAVIIMRGAQCLYLACFLLFCWPASRSSCPTFHHHYSPGPSFPNWCPPQSQNLPAVFSELIGFDSGPSRDLIYTLRKPLDLQLLQPSHCLA